jgi:hypothetical protein
VIPNPDRNVHCRLCGGRISRVNTGLVRPLPNRIDRRKTQDACVRRLSVHERGHEKTWEWKHIRQCYCCAYSLLGVKVVFVFAAREQILVVVLRFALFAFLSFRSAFAFCLPLCVSEKLRRVRMRHLGPMNHF